MARILVFTPTYNDLLQTETVESIAALSFDGELECVVSDDNPYPGRDMRNVTHQFQKGRQMALDGGYDAILLIEHDMIVPEHTAQALWDTPADVVYGTYELRHGMRALNLFQYVGKRNIGMTLSLYPRELQAMRRRGWGVVSGAGFGCLLIKRETLAAIPFRETDNAPDLPFAVDTIRAGLQPVGRLDVICGHIDTETGTTLWPFEGGGDGMIARVIANQDVVINDEGAQVAMKKGHYYSIQVTTARELRRAGYVSITNDAVAVADAGMETAEDMAAAEREMAVAPTVRKRRKATAPKKAAD